MDMQEVDSKKALMLANTTQTITYKKISYTCTFKIRYTDKKVVSKKTKITCTPKNKKPMKLKNISFTTDGYDFNFKKFTVKKGKAKRNSIRATVKKSDGSTTTATTGTTQAPVTSTAAPGTTQAPVTSTAAPGACDATVTFPKLTSPVTGYPKYTTVFGVPIFATSGYSDAKFQYIAGVMANLLDNDNDGCEDTPAAVKKLREGKITEVCLNGTDTGPPSGMGELFEGQGFSVASLLYEKEVKPECVYPKNTDNCIDASFEEILHLITGRGYATALPLIFSEKSKNGKPVSKLGEAMDVARGGHYKKPPSKRPNGAWYYYTDRTCKYNCQATEYIWWCLGAYSSYFDRQTYMLKEFSYNTNAKLVAGDVLMTALIRDTSTYRLPTIPPTGVYTGCNTCASGMGVSHGGTS